MQLVQQVMGKMYIRKNERSEKMVIVTFGKSLLLRKLKISEPTLSMPPLYYLSTPINRSDKDCNRLNKIL